MSDTGMTWGGRFQRGPHPDMLAFTSSIATDMRLLPYDVAATRAHARVLAAAGLLEASEVAAIDAACEELLARWESGALTPSPTDEDVHSLVERVLTEQLDDVGRRIHAGRSRNDLVATDLRLWCRDAAAGLIDRLGALIAVLTDFAEGQSETIMPGYTHLQRAQPVSFGFHMLAHGFSLLRDARRFRAAYDAADVSALGAGALAGNTLGLDPDIAARELGFSKTFDNAMDAVSDRDFACDLVFAAATCAVHLSRLAEEIVLWTSAEFGFARIADDWSTGSSMMPQKRNPDVAELVRGRSAGSIADLTGLLTLLKGLPLAYDRDLQEDKGFVFDAVDRIGSAVTAMAGLLGAIRLDKQRLADAAAGGAAWATDVAEALVRSGVPFRVAHEKTGALVVETERSGGTPSPAALQALGINVKLDPVASVEARSSHGGPAPERVAEQTAELRSAIARLRS